MDSLKKPIIGITLDSQDAGGYSPFAWYALRKEYFASVTKLGGVAMGLAHEIDLVDDYLDKIDGLMLTGGDFDIPPELYGENVSSNEVVINDSRTKFEWELTQKAIERDIPILGICAGQQLLNVILGGTLYQHIPDEIPNALEHQQPTPRNESWHRVIITHNTLLHRIIGNDVMEVNSNHHQAVKNVGDNVVINAVAPDGVIEGIEYINHPFCLGVEWHPEHEISAGDRNIIAAFIDASRAR